MSAKITLSQTHPTIPGRRNRYRERWALVNGHVYRVYADDLHGMWTVESDVEHLDGMERLAFVQSDAYLVDVVFTLADARTTIAAWAEDVTP
jgi:hypothetical protein